LDFHSIPANSEAEFLDKHYISSRSRSQKGILAFLARDVDENVICYGNSGVPRPEMPDEILRFTEHWKDRTGAYPKELVFDFLRAVRGATNYGRCMLVRPGYIVNVY